MNLLQRAAVPASILMFAACGGGGGDSGNSGFVPPTDVFNVRAAWQNLLAAGGTWSGITGRANDNRTFVVSVQTAPGPAQAFPLGGVTYNRSVQTVTTVVNGGSPSVAVNELFVDAGLLWRGSRHSIDNAAPTCDAPTAASQLPPMAATFDTVGTPVTGGLLAGTLYGSCINTNSVLGSASTTWSLEFEAGIVYFCLNTTSQDMALVPNVTTESDCIQVAPDGTLRSRARITLRSAGFELIARN